MNLSLKIKTILCLWALIGSSSVYASSFSSNYSVNDESLDFANNAASLESSSFTMDLSGIFWTDRPSESASFVVIDANSDLDPLVPPPPPPPPGGGGGPIAGGRPDRDPGETDVAIIGMLPEEQKPDLDLHESAEEIDEKPFVPYIPAPATKPVQVGLVYDDFDGCSAQFEMKYMQSNPYLNDTDRDGVEDCDEDWVYDTNPIVENDHFIHAGIAQAEEFVYTQLNPLFVGRADFGLEDSYTEKHVQLGIELVDPITEIGMFFLELKEDMNCIGLSEIGLESGDYKAVLYRDGQKQENPNDVYINLEQEYEDLLVSVPEGGMLNHDDRFVAVGGSTGANYGVVALWSRDEYIDVSAVVADYKGDYYLASPKQLEDGDYTIYLYGLFEEDERLIQTNYQVLDVKMEEGVPYIVERVEEKEMPKWKTAFNQAKAQIDEQKIMHASANEADPMYLLSYGIFLMIVIISYFVVWSKEN
jgi:hypothetical protein